MKSKNSIQGEPLLPVGVPRILVSYYRTSMETEEYDLVSRLITDLRSAGINVVIDEIQDMHIALTTNVQAYDWILLIQTKDVPGFALVKKRLAKALDQDGKKQLQKILNVSVSASPAQTMIATSDMSNTFDAGIDYPRAFAAIMLTLLPNKLVSLHGIERGKAPAFSAPGGPLSGVIPDSHFLSRRVANSRYPLYTLFIILIAFILLGVIVIHSFTLSSVKTTAIRTTATKTTTSNQHIKPATTTTSPEALYIQVTSRIPVINDSLQSQSADQWDITQLQGVSCGFTNGSYHVSIMPPYAAPRRHACLAEGIVFANLAIQVDMKLLQGDVGGLVFRANGRSSYYWFSLDAQGCYKLVLLTADGQIQVLSKDKLSCLHINMQSTNQLTALAQGSNIYLYINGRFIQHYSNPSFTTGGIGLVAIKRTLPTDVAFTNLKVWRLA